MSLNTSEALLGRLQQADRKIVGQWSRKRTRVGSLSEESKLIAKNANFGIDLFGVYSPHLVQQYLRSVASWALGSSCSESSKRFWLLQQKTQTATIKPLGKQAQLEFYNSDGARPWSKVGLLNEICVKSQSNHFFTGTAKSYLSGKKINPKKSLF